jgi:death-on-curing protein
MKPLGIDEAVLALGVMPGILGVSNEPITIMDKDVDVIASCLEMPFLSYEGQELYPSISAKAAVLFYQLTKGHKILNGNKRTAVILTLQFLAVNDKWLDMEQDEMYNLSKQIAKSSSKDSRAIIKDIKTLFAKKIK